MDEKKRIVAAFDFDGTLTRKDTLLEFIKYACGRRRFYAGFLLFSPLLVLMKLGLLNNGKVKEKVFSWFFKGMEYDDFSEKGRCFASLIAGFERKEMKDKLQKHISKGDEVYVVTASIEEWVRPYCMTLGVKQVLGTKVEVEDGVLTGHFSTPNCYGKEKVNRLLQAEPDLNDCTIFAYGDSRGDKEMMELGTTTLKKLQWVDIVKGVTMIMVVLLHVNYSGYNNHYYYEIKNLLGDAWDMPVFFLVGGFFISKDKLTSTTSFLKRKFRTIYAKLLYYYLAFLSIHNILIYKGLLGTEMEYGGKYMTLFTTTEFLKKTLMAVFFMGREPYLAPLWFVYVMFMAFIIIVFLSHIINKCVKGNDRKWHIAMTVTLAVLCSISLFATNTLDINIPRCNNVFSASWLIFVGYLVRNKLNMNFRQEIMAAIALVCLTGICFFCRHMALITNSYANIVQLTACGLSALYVLSYLSQLMEHTFGGKCLAFIGRKSYHIMALHLLSFNLFAAALNNFFHTSYPLSELGSNVTSLAELLLFTAVGVALPVAFITSLSVIHRIICKRK